jgi:Cys-tRNA(Pro) deacylase
MSEVVKNLLDGAGVDYKIHLTHGPTMTAQDAATQLHVPLVTIVKSIIFADQDNSPILAIVSGDKRVDRKKLASVIGASKVRIASAEDTKTLIGYEVGTMPPVGHRTRILTVMDQRVMSFSKVYGGSGTTEALIEIAPNDVARLTDAKIADICE